MISTLVAVAWYLALIALVAVLGRPHPRAASRDQDLSYEMGRWRERNEHARRVREEELAEMRRRAAHQG